MKDKKQRIQAHWGSLSLRLSAFFVVVLVTAAFAVGYLFDHGRAQEMRALELARLRLRAERGADEFQRFVRQLQGDVLFLARTPPIQGIRRAQERDGFDRIGRSDARQWKQRLQQIFLAVAAARSEYSKVRLIGVADKGRELVRVERAANGKSRAVTEDLLQAKGERYYFREAARLESGQIYLSGINLNRKHGQISVPHQPTLRAATPVQDPSGEVFALVVANVDMNAVFARVLAFKDPRESLYITNEHGDFLLHPEPGRAFAFELSTPYRLADAFPDVQERLLNVSTGSEAFAQLPELHGDVTAFVTARAWDRHAPERRLIFMLTESADQATWIDGAWLSGRLLATGALVLLVIGLVVVGVQRLTRSLREIARASHAIGAGNYRAALPAGGGTEVAGLVRAFRHMAREIETREAELRALNQDLEQRVEERTAELAQAHSLQQIILESIADGVVAVDHEGRFLLWNAKAERLIGVGPDRVAPEDWSSHFGVFLDEARTPVPAADLPLVRAMQGKSSDTVELYLHTPKRKEGRWAQVTARPLLGTEGEIIGGVSVLVDVTEQRYLRKRLELERAELIELAPLALGAAIASAAVHRLSQPIAAMNNYAGAVVRMREQRRLTEAELRDLLARIEACATKAGEGLDELRTLICHHNRPAVPVNLNQVADSCLQFLRDRIEHFGVAVDRRYKTALPRLMGDPTELSHVLIQLVSNSLESLVGIEPAERKLSVVTGHDPERGVVMIGVANGRRSVHPERATQLFDPLPPEKPDAMGIGLHIARAIVDNYEGRIYLKKGELGGLLFCVEFPVDRGGEAA